MKKLEDYTREELIDEVKSLKRQKKFGLVWENRKEDIVEKCQKNIPTLEEVEELKIEDAPGEPTNLIIEGDNYAALSVLNYTYQGKIDVIYIDPPYNTGNKDFIYNDRYIDEEDSYRHSKWLSFMNRRLKLAKKLLADDGIIFISIDDNEQSELRLLCDEIFGTKNFLACCSVVNNRAGRSDDAFFATSTEYLLVYAKEISSANIKEKNYPNLRQHHLSTETKRGHIDWMA